MKREAERAVSVSTDKGKSVSKRQDESQTKKSRKNRCNRSDLAQLHIFIQFGKKLSVINTIQFISLK